MEGASGEREGAQFQKRRWYCKSAMGAHVQEVGKASGPLFLDVCTTGSIHSNGRVQKIRVPAEADMVDCIPDYQYRGQVDTPLDSGW